MATDHGLILYGYWRSSASYRVRLALALKGLDYVYKPISLIDQGGQQFHPDYVALNPQASVPTLIHQDRILTQSLAIIEYLDETFPDHPLLPKDTWARAQVRALALAIATDIAPLGNLRVLHKIEARLGNADDHKAAWARHWIELGFNAIETLLKPHHNAPQSRCIELIGGDVVTAPNDDLFASTHKPIKPRWIIITCNLKKIASFEITVFTKYI